MFLFVLDRDQGRAAQNLNRQDQDRDPVHIPTLGQDRGKDFSLQPQMCCEASK